MADGPTSGTPRTEADLLTNFFQEGQANNSITSQDMRDLITSARFLQPLGWEFRFDSQYTTSNRLTLNSTGPVRQKMTFTAFPGEDLRYPSTFPEIWNDAGQKIDISTFLNGFGIIRLSLCGEYTGGTIPHLEIDIDVGDDPLAPAGTGTATNIIYTDTQTFAKAAGDIQAFNFIVPLFGGNDFVKNGGQVLIAAHNADVEVWQFTITAGAILVVNPAGEG